MTTELYPGATQDVHIIRTLAAKMTNGKAFAAQSLSKTANYISGNDGERLNSRYEALLRVATTWPETAEIINGLELVKLGNDLAVLVKLAQMDDNIPTALALGAAINTHPLALARIAAQHVDDVELGELRANDIPWLAAEWNAHNRARTAR